MAKTKTEKRIHAQKALEKSKLGFGEPIFDPLKDGDTAHPRGKIWAAFNWYSEHSSPKKEREWVIHYIGRRKLLSKQQIAVLEKASLSSFDWLGRVCRMIDRGAVFEKNDHFQDRLQRLLQSIQVQETPTNQCDSTPVSPSIQDRLDEKCKDLSGDLIAEYESWEPKNLNPKNGKQTGEAFNTSQWCNSKEIKPAHCSRLIDSIKQEIEILETDMENNLDGYIHPKKFLIGRIEALKQLIDGLQKHSLEKKVNRKPRKRKPKDPVKLVSKMKFCKEDKELSLTSVSPIKIIGCQYLLVYNAKYRKMTLFEASGPEGLSVKGSTILGWNLDTSVTYRLRKPEKFFKAVNGQGIRKIRNEITALTTKPATTKGRIGKDTVLVAVL